MDAVTVAEFESDLKNNLYKIWNRLSSGTYFPPPVRAVEIPKPHAGHENPGVPCVGDRCADVCRAIGAEQASSRFPMDDLHSAPPRDHPVIRR